MRTRTIRSKRRSSAYRLDLRRTREQLRAEHEALKLQFILTELDLALTFCDVAMTSGDEVRSQRNLLHAREAYEVAKKFLAEAAVSPPVRHEVEQKVLLLEGQLHNLGELEPESRLEHPNPRRQ